MIVDGTMESLVAILERLRAPNGCPWDREQTRETLARCLAEECAEFLEAVDLGETDAICDELGDLLMNVVFQAIVATEQGEFTLADVVKGISEKMIRRHVHIFGDASAATSDDVLNLWEQVKAKENKGKRNSILDGISPEMSALSRGEKIQKKVAKVGFDWSNQQDILAKIAEEYDEVVEAMAKGDEEHVDEELGDMLFAVTNLIRYRKRASAEELMRRANRKFTERFKYIEQSLKAENISLESATLERMEQLWNEAKKAPLKY